MRRIFAELERYWAVVALLAGVLVYGIVMLLATGQSVWFDEGYSILLARSTYGELFALTAVDAHPPLYYLVLRAWGDVFGFSEFALRSLSAIFAGGAATGALILVRHIFGLKAGLTTLGILLLSPFFLRYGYEVRMYSLATLIGVWATYMLVRAREGGSRVKWFWGVYAVLVALGMYTLYMMAAVWLAHVVWLALQSIRMRQPVLRWRWAYVYIAAVGLFVPYLPFFVYQLQHSALPGIGSEVTPSVIADIASVLLLFTPEWGIGGWLTLLLGALIAVLTLLGVRVYRGLDTQRRLQFMLLVSLAVVPIVFYALTSLPPREPIFVVRYMAHVAIWIYVLVGVVLGVGLSQEKLRHLSLLGATLLMGTLLVGVTTLANKGNFVFERMQKPMTQELRSAVTCDDDTVIVANDPYTYIDTVFYFEGCDLRFYADSTVEKKGGYAPLHESGQRIESTRQVAAPRLLLLHWGESAFEVDGRYTKVDRQVYGKQHLDTYLLTEE